MTLALHDALQIYYTFSCAVRNLPRIKVLVLWRFAAGESKARAASQKNEYGPESYAE